jgi:hypothetical protein
MRASVAALIFTLVACSSPSPSPSAIPTQSGPESPAAASHGESAWLTGRELMDVLSEEFGYEWFELAGDGPSSFWSADPASNPPTMIQVIGPVDQAATVTIGASVGEFGELASPHVDRVTQILAPDAAAWVADAVDQALAGSSPSYTQTATGGYVDVALGDEVDLTDWMNVLFSTDDPVPLH